MASALRERPGVSAPNDKELACLRLGALLHDCGHVPFSHASEPSVARTDLYRAAKEGNPDLFTEGRKPHEMLSHLIVKSRAFEGLWEKIVSLHAAVEP